MKLVPVAEQLSILTSRHPDGQIVAAAAESFGCSSIDGSGASFKQDEGTGGMSAMREMVREMKRGQSIGITADIPPRSRSQRQRWYCPARSFQWTPNYSVCCFQLTAHGFGKCLGQDADQSSVFAHDRLYRRTNLGA